MTKEKRIELFNQLGELSKQAVEIMLELQKCRDGKDYPATLRIDIQTKCPIHGRTMDKVYAGIHVLQGNKTGDLDLPSKTIVDDEKYPCVRYKKEGEVAFFSLSEGNQ